MVGSSILPSRTNACNTLSTLMTIKFNEVTWYSKLGAVVLFLLVVPVLTFYIGMKYQETAMVLNSTPRTIEINTSGSVSKNATPSASSSSILVETSDIDIFTASIRSENISNVIGFFSSGAFFWYVPDWVVEHWRVDHSGITTMVISPKDDTKPRDFSDIVISIASSTENMNAETLYSRETHSSEYILCLTNTRCESRQAGSDILISEVILSPIGDTRIYHIARLSANGTVTDRFFFDGVAVTATATFSAPKEKYGTYGLKIRELIQGIGKGTAPQG